MFNSSTKKVIRDLLGEKRRTLAVLLAMIIGVFAVTMMSTSKSLLDKNLTENFLRTNPAAFSIFVNNAHDSVLQTIREMPEIAQVTTRKSVWIRMKKPDGTFLPVLLYVVDDVEQPLISTYKLDAGNYPKEKNEIVIERTGIKLTQLESGQSVELHFPGYASGNYTISGFVHDAGIAPSWMEGYLYGYISASSLPQDYLAKFVTEIKCTVAENTLDRSHIEAVSKQTLATLENKGIESLNCEIHEPGVHMHQKQMNALMFLILNFGILVLILSCFLIINMISAIMAKEKKQIAIMKAMGASSVQISRIYITTILIMAIASLIVGIPLGAAAGKAFSTFNASMLNFELFDVTIDHPVLFHIVFIGIFMPIVVSLLPIINSSRVSVHKALQDTGVENVSENTHFSSLISRIFSGSFLLALRNAFRRKTRMAITVISLSIGGAIFISAFNIRKSTNMAIENNFDKQNQDIIYQFTGAVNNQTIDSIFMNRKVTYELGFRAQGCFDLGNNLFSKNFSVTAIEEDGKLITPVISEGRWVEKGKPEIVINQILQKENTSFRIGARVELTINGTNESYTIVGICREMFTPAGLFMGKMQYAGHLNINKNTGNLLLVDALTNNPKIIAEINANLEKEFKANKINTVNSITKESYKVAVVEHLLIIMIMLFSMTILVIVVGGLGMATSININVNERIRELGILRAIGILKKDLRAMVMTEAITMTGLSWILAILFAIPLSIFLGNEFFSIFFESTMKTSVSAIGIGLWLLLAIVIGIISSIAPANRIIRQEVAEALSYE